MSLLNVLVEMRRHCGASPATPAAPTPAPRRAVAPSEPLAGVADDDTAGCGWFDSSHALQCGLLVTEHDSAGAVAGDLPLSDWLGLHLAGWPGLAGAGHCAA